MKEVASRCELADEGRAKKKYFRYREFSRVELI
jgi:hypothetical protein